jgi:Protein of unknown function (DUF3788)
MTTSAFEDKAVPPTETTLAAILRRAIVYMTPRRGHFVASFVLGEKACAAARAARLPPAVMQAIDEAPRYAEGRGIRIPVRTAKDVQTVEALAALKTAK